MALRNKSLFLYGYQITENNRSLDFKAAVTDVTPRQATLRLGFYSLNSLSVEIKRAMQSVDGANTYTITADRSVAGGQENRVTISTSGLYLQLLFSTGPRAASSVAPLIGFSASDFTGNTQYQGTVSTGSRLVPTQVGYSYTPPDFNRKVFGAVNVSASGLKEAVVFNIQRFFSVDFQFEPQAYVQSSWVPFMTWAIQQRRFEFTPDVSDPYTVYECTLEKTSEDGKGLGYMLKEMLPNFPFHYQTNGMTFRVVESENLAPPAPTPPPPPPSGLYVGLISSWRMNETTGLRLDSVGSNDLTPQNGVGFTTGVISNAADFNASLSQYLETPSINWGFGNAWAVSVWHKQNSAAGDTGIFQFGNDMSVATPSTFKFAADYLYVSDSASAIFKHFNAIPLITSYGNTIITWDGTSMKVYRDGTDITGSLGIVVDNPGVMADDIRELTVGAARNGSPVSFLDGSVDIINVWNRALTPSEVLNVYNLGAGVEL